MINIEKIKANPAAMIGRFFLYLVVIVGAVVFMIPFAWMVRTSVMPRWQVEIFPPIWIPERLVFDAWVRPFDYFPFYDDFFYNAAIISILTILGTVASSSVVAYGFSRLRFPFRDIIFLFVLSTMMLPYQVTLIPQYLIFSRLKWINTWRPLIVPHFFGSAFHIFLLRQFFMTIPTELDDAAKIDGCSLMGIFWRILLPLSRPALGIVAIMTFTGSWNNFMGPLIYLNDQKKYPIALGLNVMRSSYELQFDIEALMAATIMALVPVLAVFFVAQKYFVQGIVITGVKG